MLQGWVDPAVAQAWAERDHILRQNGFPDKLPESLKTDDWLKTYEESGQLGINPLIFTGLEPQEWVQEREGAKKKIAISPNSQGKSSVRKKSR